MDIALTKFQDWHTAVAKAFTSLHSKQFPAALIDALGKLVRIESVMVTLEYTDRAPVLLYDQGIPKSKRDLMINRYLSVGYMLDPCSLAVSGGLAEGFCLLSEVAPDNFYESSYYKTYYLAAGSVEDCYFVVDVGENSKISIGLYRGYYDEQSIHFTPHEIAALRAVEPMIKQLILSHWTDHVMKHTSLQQESNQLQISPLDTALKNFGHNKLTEREQDVAHLVLRGHSTKSAARELDISPETVKEHRKNLYRKLEINTQAQLFTLFIDSISKIDS